MSTIVSCSNNTQPPHIIRLQDLGQDEKSHFFDFLVRAPIEAITYKKQTNGEYIVYYRFVTQEKKKKLQQQHVPPPQQEHSKKDLPWLLHLLDEIFVERFETFIVEIKNKIALEPFQSFIFKFLNKKYRLDSLVKSNSNDLLELTKQYKNESKTVELFALFLTEAYDQIDLLFYLLIRHYQKENHTSTQSLILQVMQDQPMSLVQSVLPLMQLQCTPEQQAQIMLQHYKQMRQMEKYKVAQVSAENLEREQVIHKYLQLKLDPKQQMKQNLEKSMSDFL